ncbi:RNA polymerase sigma-70 factor (ECF subfamily) [Bacillus tianshenii]|uniref:RNA polymerase sigma-70 factor (ECF subfamily) n=1 Tax=Sutcliffiella tianshenii TaxID=1463404 RepID=A0ABS2NUY3_9BACI|nr:sigma-70 family RNA polymerase sigma factor [Bacillus tianshenii]MBM7618477.1 RNA polymerase sigma-70 factor (ECF subfamily) [Bacillus tianshenii]
MEAMEEHEMSISKESLLESLIEDYGTELKRVAYLYVKDQALAEDIIQEVFISCYHHLDSFRQESSYRTWLMRITVNKSKDALKRWSFRNFISKAEIEPEVLEQNTPESATVSGMEKKELIQEVLKLPIKLREVIILFYYKDLSVEEISTILQLNENTIKTRLFRAREKLKIKLERSENAWKSN